ncbi:DUF2652 domain-containing protein [Flavihumibacter sp. R14]|nr:DUF2652 domain-containing protein [Flavihumibacter soli]
MESKGLLFIPDISGFTRFVNQTEIEHTRLIIQELLESIINSNQIGLEVSEIEGDAILFYKFGEPPALEELYQQVEKMFCEFHTRLIAYDRRRFCYCAACNSAIDLTLKVITHYGEFTEYHVGNFDKLIGKDIIIAHQLLKNDIEQHEYWLVTKDLVPGSEPSDMKQWMKWSSSAKQTDSGEVTFHYTQLSALKEQLGISVESNVDLSGMVKMVSLSKEYEVDIITLFHTTGDFNYRSRWHEGVKAVEEIEHLLPRVGMRCRCIREDGEAVIYASSYAYNPHKIEFTETEEKSKNVVHYLLEKTGPNKTRLTIDLYIQKNFTGELKYKLLKRNRTEAELRRSMENIATLVKEINLPALAG